MLWKDSVKVSLKKTGLELTVGKRALRFGMESLKLDSVLNLHNS